MAARRVGAGSGCATEASGALLASATPMFRGEVLAMIDPRNVASQRVADKLGFTFWKMAEVGGFVDRIYRLRIGS